MITARQFGQSFEATTYEQMATLFQSWSSQPSFTQYVKEKMMPAIASKLGCTTQLEYKRFDIIFRALDAPNTIAVAIEHENNFGGSHQEVTKLRDLNASLGVLITYVSIDRRQTLITEFDEIMSSVAEQRIASVSGELLVIFGPYGMTPPKSLTWEYFVHRGSGFEKMSI